MNHDQSPAVLRVARAALLVWTFALTWHFLRAPFETILATFEDDAFYYLTIARHMALGDGSTFDGIHRTNGYHPLWCWTLVPFMRCFAGQPEAGVRAASILCVWLRLGASLLLLQTLRRAFDQPWATAIAVLAFFVVGNGFSTNGMEEALEMLCLTAFLATARDRPAGPTLGRAVVLARGPARAAHPRPARQHLHRAGVFRVAGLASHGVTARRTSPVHAAASGTSLDRSRHARSLPAEQRAAIRHGHAHQRHAEKFIPADRGRTLLLEQRVGGSTPPHRARRRLHARSPGRSHCPASATTARLAPRT